MDLMCILAISSTEYMQYGFYKINSTTGWYDWKCGQVTLYLAFQKTIYSKLLQLAKVSSVYYI